MVEARLCEHWAINIKAAISVTDSDLAIVEAVAGVQITECGCR